MANIGRQHHHDLLSKGIHEDPHEREEAMKSVLEEVNEDSKLPKASKTKLGQPIDENIIKTALKYSADGSSPGYNGIPYEFWKMLANNPRYNLKKGPAPTNNEEPPDIVKILTNIYLDTKKHGIHPDSAFAEGWMCPLYKKKDK
ncbi:hypothetical protein PILCRDRAFT_10186 [Piloderma croceum F 1598]|uniref:Uncharacterized protein n=1 Tax=Piloderma croceum (strain F 1598) TaxID=765440 RepID=A0A0C3B0D8_PILCF|nr:hypothetical protein PILCRDRAFT_10186 [Piloderma croceum F 1598]